MKTCRFKNSIVDYLYHELAVEKLHDFEKHLNNCPDCAEDLNQFSDTRNLIANRVRPLPDKKLLNNYHHNLKEIYKGDSFLEQLIQNIVIKPSFAVRLAEIAVILIIGIFIGKSLTKSETALQISKQNIIDGEFLNNYLFETELLLLETSNIDDAQDIKLILDTDNCKRLLQKTLLLKEQAENFNKTRLLSLLDQLEFILLELANFEDSSDKEDLDFVKNNIKDWHLFVELKAINTLNLL